MKRVNQLLAPGLKYYVIASAPFIAAFFLVPFELYYNGQEYWDFEVQLLLRLPMLGLVACGIVLVLLRSLAMLSVRWAMDAAVLLFCLGTFLLLADLYSPLQMSELDGTELTAAEPMARSVLEVALAIGLAFAFMLLRKGRHLIVAHLFSLAIIAVSLAYGGLIALTGREASSQVTVAKPQSGLAGNVYHIVLDEMQTDVFLTVLQRGAYRQHFDGFELFHNNVSNYISTSLSLPSYLTSTFYHEGELADWQDDWKTKGLLPALNDSGYALSMYSPFKEWRNEHVDRFTYLMDVYEQETGTVGSDFPEFVVLWLVRLAPNFLASEALALSTAFGEQFLAPRTLGGKPAPAMTHRGRQPLASVFMMRRMIADEERRMPDGEYVYAHAILPHQPYVMDEGCRYDPDMPEGRSSHLAQAECGVRLVSAFMAELERLGRYDAATIIVHADHGSWTGFTADPRAGPDPARESAAAKRPEAIYRLALAGPEASRWVEMQERVTRRAPIMRARTRALLMIKRPHDEGPLRVSRELTQLVDVFPTVLDILDLDPSGHPLHGRSVYELDERGVREARYGFRAEEELGVDVVEVRIEDQEDLVNSDLTLVGPATDPRVWREELRHLDGIASDMSR